MRAHQQSLLQPLTILLSTLALGLTASIPTDPALPLPLLSSPLNDTSLTSRGVHCQSSFPFSPFYLTMHSCASAIYEIHPDEAIGDFHTGEPYDDFSLPVTRKSGYCKVTVEMDSANLEDTSSWLGVSHALTQLNLLCASRWKYRYQGGWSLTGQRNAIKVRLDWYTASASQNQTLAELGAVSNA